MFYYLKLCLYRKISAGNRRQRNHDKTERDTTNDVGGGASNMSVNTSESSKPVKKKAKTSRKLVFLLYNGLWTNCFKIILF